MSISRRSVRRVGRKQRNEESLLEESVRRTPFAVPFPHNESIEIRPLFSGEDLEAFT
jgi:hypothetical protein